MDAAGLLRSLLERPGPYRDRWMRQNVRYRGRLDQSAVAQVLSAYLWDSGTVSDTDVTLPRRLKDRVSRALGGKSLPPGMLELFINAFQMSDVDAQQLWGALLDDDTGSLLLVRSAMDHPNLPAHPRGYHTVATHELHTVGADRLPAEHRTLQVIRADTDVTFYRHRFDTSSVAVQVLRGGHADAVYATDLEGVFAIDIVLSSPLHAGQTGSLEYRSIFNYPEPQPPVFRVVAERRIENVDLNVEFHPDALPAAVYWGVWSDLESEEPEFRQEWELDADYRAHRFVEAMEDSVAGFYWQW